MPKFSSSSREALLDLIRLTIKGSNDSSPPGYSLAEKKHLEVLHAVNGYLAQKYA
jgi:hypothetical protein